MRELIVDITYNCNSECKYCQWSINNTLINRDVSIKKLLISREKLEKLEISKIVINGGEPLLSEYLERILDHYHDLNFPIKMISNGILLNKKSISKCIEKGCKEFVISLDSLSYDTYRLNRVISRASFQKIFENLNSMYKELGNKIQFIGINVVLTSLNCNWQNISKILQFAIEKKLTQIKFQPVFDDGFLSRNAPYLKLNVNCRNDIQEIREKINNFNLPKNFTNPFGFWNDLLALITGETLNPNKCSIDENAILLHNGILKFCYWCKHTDYGSLNAYLTKTSIEENRHKFRNQLYRCEVLPQCFCLQKINHRWLN